MAPLFVAHIFAWTSFSHPTLAHLLNSLRTESGRRDMVSLLPNVTTPFCIGIPVKRQQPISVIMEICLLDYAFQSHSCVNTKV